MRADQIFTVAAVLPPALLVAAVRESSRQEGWGGWAVAASLGPVVIGFSAVMTLIGLVLWLVERRRGRHRPSILAATLLAGTPCLWLAVKSV